MRPNLPKWLSKLRAAHGGMSEEEFAAHIGMSIETYRRLEAGDNSLFDALSASLAARGYLDEFARIMAEDKIGSLR